MHKVLPDTQKSITNTLANLFFRFFALNFNKRPSLNKYLKCDEGWLNFTFGWKATFVVTGALGFLWLALWPIV